MKSKILLMALAVALLGCFSIPIPVMSAEPIILGCPTALKSDWGYDSLHAAEYAVEEINAKGGVLVGGQKRPFKIVTTDTRGMDPATPVHDSLMATEKLILNKKPHAIVIGFARSEAFMAGMDMIAKYKIPYIGAYAQTHMFQKKFAEDPNKYKYLFRTAGDAIITAKTVTTAIDVLKNDYGLNKAFFMPQGTLLSKGFNGVLKKHCEATGWQILGWEVVASDATDFSAVLAKIKEQKAQMICTFWDVAQGGTILLKQWASMKVPALIVGFVVGACSPRGWDLIGPDVEYCIQTEAPIGCSIPLKKVPKTREFVERFIKKYGKPRGQWLTGAAYDGVYVLAEAIERAGCLDSDKVVSEIEKTDYKGVIGRIKFDKTHQVIYGIDPEETGVCLSYQWQKGGKMVPIYPPSVAEGKVLLPPWMK